MKKLSKHLESLGYYANPEFSGHEAKPIVLRFRGEFVAACVDIKEASLLAIFHDDERTAKIL